MLADPLRCSACRFEILDPADLDPSLRAAWARSGWSEDEILYLHSRGVAPVDASAWRTHRFHVMEAADWLVAGISATEAAWWESEVVVSDPEVVRRWKASGRHIDEIVTLIRSGFHDPGEVDEWAAGGFTVDEAIKWRPQLSRDWDTGQYDIDGREVTVTELARWKRTGFTATNFARWCIRFSEPVEAMLWHDQKINPQVAADLRHEGLAPAAAREEMDRRERIKRGLPPGKSPSISRTLSGPMCGWGKHDQCDDLRTCACSCHCWHDGQHDDWEQTAAHVGRHPPHFMLGTQRSRHCLDGRHDGCLTSTRCRCHCHCFHHDL